MVVKQKLVEYLLYKLRQDPLRYAFIRGRQVTLASLLYLLRDMRFNNPDIKALLENLPNQDFGTNLSWVHYYEDGRVEISSNYDEDESGKSDFVTTIPELVEIFNAWREVYMSVPPYIFVALDSDKQVSFTAVNDLSDLPELEYDIVNE